MLSTSHCQVCTSHSRGHDFLASEDPDLPMPPSGYKKCVEAELSTIIQDFHAAPSAETTIPKSANYVVFYESPQLHSPQLHSELDNPR